MASGRTDSAPSLKLDDGSQVAVIGGGPSGSMVSYFLLEMSKRVGIDIGVDIYEPQDFSRIGPAGCNHCGGIVSESLVQLLATEGINLPPRVVRRGIDSYVLHMHEGSIRIDTPLHEKRIASIFRGAGPRGAEPSTWVSFDGFLQEIAVRKGTSLIREKVDSVSCDNGRPQVATRSGESRTYDLVVGATGVNTASLKIFSECLHDYRTPQLTKTFICEFLLGQEMIRRYLGNSMHVFLLNIPRLQFAALIPKGNFATLCLLGDDIDKELVQSFLESPEVRNCFPPSCNVLEDYSCQCYPKINVRGAGRPFADRVVLLGDCSVTRLYKDGIGAAYVTAKAVSSTAVFHGISERDFKKHYWPTCSYIGTDNAIGKIIFGVTHQIQRTGFFRKAILKMVSKEQRKDSNLRHMSTVLWDTFTGSAPYREIFLRTLYPAFLTHLIWETSAAIFNFKRVKIVQENLMDKSTLGKVYQDGETVVKQGEMGDCMYVIQSGRVEVLQSRGDKEICIAELGEEDFFGEMALFEQEVRSTSVRAKGEVSVLTVDKKTLLRRIQQDPSLAFRLLQKMSSRLRDTGEQLTNVRASDRRNWKTRRPD